MFKRPCVYVQENSRADRIRNIATAYFQLRDDNPGKDGVTTDRLRAHIREALKLPKLDGEAHLGDLRAHGDAVGKHGLCLQVDRKKVSGKSVRVVAINEVNDRLIKAFLDAQKDNTILS